ncbi:hypothetical protein KV112_02425 [Mycolicibacter sp. MYC123]|uniref:PE-PPE domain-containing protein n=1 Tax=[Mycobacterium] zoologicum TaxID=2872311 RepID=A0ABU5YEY1_9MYCO|nr:hypothetical protein [Mycolicibacter sp. MYC123]MEB3048601.1 hypothetical protein [Mycolicibacter sp. MYC123]
MNPTLRPYAVGGVAVVGAALVAITPITVPAPRAHILLSAGDSSDVYIDIVRHAAPSSPPPDFATETPGPGLCSDFTAEGCGGGSPPFQTGYGQADFTAHTLFGQFGPVSGVFAGNSVRDLETAAAYANLLHDQNVDLPASQTPDLAQGTPGFDPGINQLWQLNEAYSSFLLPQETFLTPGGILFQLEVLLWSSGLTLLPMPGGVPSDGVMLDQDFTQAVDIMYANSANGITSDDGNIHEIGFNNDASISAWTLLNVKNPDLLYFLPAILDQITSGSSKQLLDFGGIVEVNGNPDDGWTLDSWNGTAIPSFPDPLTELFVLTRDVILPPQALVYNVEKAILAGNPQDVVQAAVAGIEKIAQAIAQTPGDLFDYTKTAVTDPELLRASFTTGPSDLVSPSGELPNPADASNDAGAVLDDLKLGGLDPGDLGASV